MATNKNIERFATFQFLQPVGINIASGQALLFGKGTHQIPCVACEAQNTTLPPYDSNTGYISVDATGVYNLSVHANTSGSVSAGAQINPGDPVFADGGTYDPVSGLTYGITLSADANGSFFGLSMDKLVAGTIGTIRIILKNAC